MPVRYGVIGFRRFEGTYFISNGQGVLARTFLHSHMKKVLFFETSGSYYPLTQLLVAHGPILNPFTYFISFFTHSNSTLLHSFVFFSLFTFL